MIPDVIRRHHVEAAIAVLNETGWPPRMNSTKYDLVDGLVRVPPKQAVREAARIARVPIGSFHGGDETNKFLVSRGFRVLPKDR